MTSQNSAQLKADVRTVVGKKVRFLRRSGLTPANVYGHNVESQAVQLNTEELVHTLRHTPRTALMTLNVSGERTARPVLIRHLQRHPVHEIILHIDFYQVSMTEKMTTSVPVHVVGMNPVIADLGGMVVQEVNSVEIECLPGDIPSSLEVDISQLDEIGGSLHVRDLKAAYGVEILADEDVVIVRIASGEVSQEEPAATVTEETEAASESE